MTEKTDPQPLTDEEVEERITLLREYDAAVEMHFHNDSVSMFPQTQHRSLHEARDKFFMAFSRDDIARILARIRADGKRIEKMEWLLCHIQQWDMLDTTADGNYWKQQIQAALEDKTK